MRGKNTLLQHGFLYLDRHFLEVSLTVWGKRSFEEAGKVYLRIQADQMLSVKYVRQRTLHMKPVWCATAVT